MVIVVIPITVTIITIIIIIMSIIIMRVIIMSSVGIVVSLASLESLCGIPSYRQTHWQPHRHLPTTPPSTTPSAPLPERTKAQTNVSLNFTMVLKIMRRLVLKRLGLLKPLEKLASVSPLSNRPAPLSHSLLSFCP